MVEPPSSQKKIVQLNHHLDLCRGGKIVETSNTTWSTSNSRESQQLVHYIVKKLKGWPTFCGKSQGLTQGAQK